jgi:hypothetical protein
MGAEQDRETVSIIVGAVYVARRSRSGRHWRLRSINGAEKCVTLDPIGDDVQTARSGTTGRWQGGPRAIRVQFDELIQRWVRFE